MSEEKIVYNACQGWGCHERCILETHVEDGKIVRTTGAALLGGEPKRGGCQKGVMAGKIPYMPTRITHPLKRVGERGEGKFERISWDQALDEIGAKINELKDKYGTHSIVVNTFPCGYPMLNNALHHSLLFRFIHTFDAGRLDDQCVDKAAITVVTMEYGSMHFCGDIRLINEAQRHLIIWGGNPIGFARPAWTSRMLMDAQERGVKLVSIGTVFDSTAAKVDQFVPIKAGTDAALALTMANQIIERDCCDMEFLASFTVAPFLVREDNGRFLRESDISDGGNPANYVYYDQIANAPKSIAPLVFEFENAKPDMLADITVEGIACKTVFLRLKEEIAEWTPEKQEPITGVPAEIVNQLVDEYLGSPAAMIYLYFGLRYLNAAQAARAINLLPLLSGNLKHKGGRIIIQGASEGESLGFDGCFAVAFPEGLPCDKGDFVTMIKLLESFENPDRQQYKALLNAMGNPVLNWPNRELWTKRVFPNLELIVSIEIRMCDTAMYADYVLPEASIFERLDIVPMINHTMILNEPGIDPIGESRDAVDIWSGIAQRVGVGQFFTETVEDYHRIRLKAEGTGITLERLKEEKLIQMGDPNTIFDPFEKLRCHTPSGKVEFYNEDLAAIGSAFATFFPAYIHSQDKEKYPLHFFAGRHRFFMQGQFTDIPELRSLASNQFGVALNPKTALEYGLVAGDQVEVFNDKGFVRGPLRLSEGFPPGMAHVWYSYPAKDFDNNPPTALQLAMNTEETADPIMKLWGPLYFDRMVAMGAPPMYVFFPGLDSNDCVWDALCDIRKVEV